MNKILNQQKQKFLQAPRLVIAKLNGFIISLKL